MKFSRLRAIRTTSQKVTRRPSASECAQRGQTADRGGHFFFFSNCWIGSKVVEAERIALSACLLIRVDDSWPTERPASKQAAGRCGRSASDATTAAMISGIVPPFSRCFCWCPTGLGCAFGQFEPAEDRPMATKWQSRPPDAACPAAAVSDSRARLGCFFTLPPCSHSLNELLIDRLLDNRSSGCLAIGSRGHRSG